MTLNGKQFEQLPMFVTARDIHDNYAHGDQGQRYSGESETVDELYSRKRDEVRAGVLGRSTSSVPVEGVREPVWAGVDREGNKKLWEGHHRVAMQHGADPDRLIPIKFGASGLMEKGEEDTEADLDITSSYVRNKIANAPRRLTVKDMVTKLRAAGLAAHVPLEDR